MPPGGSLSEAEPLPFPYLNVVFSIFFAVSVSLVHCCQMLRILSGESYSSVKSEAASSRQQQAVTADVPLKSVCDSGIDSIHDLEKSGRQTELLFYSLVPTHA